jgi:hypothetical protein
MAAIKAGFRAGDMVKLKAGQTDNTWKVGVGEVQLDYAWASYHCTAEDYDQWYEDKKRATEAAIAAGKDAFSINFDDGGESRLAPRGGRTKIFADTAYRVLRARCRASFSYHNATGGWTKLLDLNSGRDVFVKMTSLEKVVTEKSQ